MRFKTKWEKLVIATIGISIGVFLVGAGETKAALQANAATHTTGKTDTGANWITNIRQMETAGQTMGLTETIGSNLVATSSSNNIDVHMMKTTEYGAMAILSASGFGWKGKLADAPVKSTTGNVTGVYVMGTRYEWTAGVCSASTVGKDARYYDLYTTAQTSAKVGDALGLDTYTDNPGCSGWHGASNSLWLHNLKFSFIRGDGGMFSFFGSKTNTENWASNTYCGRGVAVVQSGV